AVLDRITVAFEGTPAQGPDWHRSLLRVSGLEIERVRPAILGSVSSLAADELRRFRHFLRHAYPTPLDAAKALAVATSWMSSAAESDVALARFGRFLDELPTRLEGDR